MRKTPKCQNTLPSSPKQRFAKRPFELPQEKTSSPSKKMVGILKTIENP